jgi:AcrR family transcriptional regulator
MAVAGAPAGAEVVAKRDAILDAALALFCERTYDGTPVPLVAERAGVAVGTIYRCFADKEALVNAVYRRAKTDMRAELTRDVVAGLDAREEFHRWWLGLWRFATERPLAFRFLETHHHAAYLDAESHAVGEAITRDAALFVRRAQAAGAVRRMAPELLISLVFGAFTGMVKAASEGGPALSRKARDASEAAVWAMLAVGGDRGSDQASVT